MDTIGQIGSREKLNLDYLRQVCFGNEDLLKEMLSMFLKNTPSQINQLYDCLKSGDWQAFKSVAHKLKSSIRVLGMNTIADDLDQLEQLAFEKTELNLIPYLLEKVTVDVNREIRELDMKLKSL